VHVGVLMGNTSEFLNQMDGGRPRGRRGRRRSDHAAIVLNAGASLTLDGFGSFLAAQPDLSPRAWPRYVRIAPDLPTTATHKVLKRELAAQGPTAGDGGLWIREPRGTGYERA
jgi:fatty-acyl-CoA synthase